MAAHTDTFSKHWDKKHGFTQREAEEKKAKVDEAHGVFGPDPKWEPAQIVPDPDKVDGYKVTISTKSN